MAIDVVLAAMKKAMQECKIGPFSNATQLQEELLSIFILSSFLSQFSVLLDSSLYRIIFLMNGMCMHLLL